ncbi:lysophosphatidic acid phosphatase type 6-like isoform X2 [Mizuhopecten yessoensis]|uniref:Lysophosphatidic acid phosphatase type 6 n=1 Tax=Mizuhopecten yessoensis TaxID=6573 RepID=A0A210PI19_MIZYE|nr:lysophosphatidic acid phosphatase type 6-like isoform X2 [Mizuhopecten yessoensis]OWF36130.1 Lysophosphatidic acid phosphatase type 6 [Mizuhopecten yessoensis]
MSWKIVTGYGVFGAAICSCTAKTLLDTNDAKVREGVASDQNTEQALRNTLTLKQAQVFFRHGARTTIHTIPKLAEANYDAKIFMHPLPHTLFDLDMVDLATGGPKTKSRLDEHYAKKKLLGGSVAGQLTTLGQQQCFMLGQKLKQDYIEGANLITEDYDPNTVFGRSTNIKRTIESLRCVMAGMFGVSNLQKIAPVKVYISDQQSEVLFPNLHNCHVLTQNNHSVLFHMGDKPEYQPERLKLEKAFGVNFKDHVGLNFVGMRDDLVARKAHGFPIPSHALPLWDTIELMASKMIYAAFCGQHKAERNVVMRLATGPLMTMVMDNIEDLEENKGNAKKLFLFATHDSTLVGMLGLLDIWDNIWPPYSADIRFELYENQNKEKFIQVLYMGKPMKVRGCDSTLCSLKQFREAMKPFMIRKDELNSICSSDILEQIDKEIKEEEKGEIQTEEVQEQSETPAGM